MKHIHYSLIRMLVLPLLATLLALAPLSAAAQPTLDLSGGGTTITGSVANSDMDLYSFVITNPGIFFVQPSVAPATDLVVQVQLLGDLLPENGPDLLIQRYLPAGNYLLAVSSQDGTPGDYSLDVEFITDLGDLAEDVETSPLASSFDEAGELKIFRFELLGPQVVTLYAANSGLDTLDTLGLLLNANNEILAHAELGGRDPGAGDDPAGNGHFALQRYLLPGTYYLLVREANARTGGFNLHAANTPPAPLAMNSFSPGESVNVRGGVRAYAFALDPQEVVFLQSTGRLDTFADLYRDGLFLRSNDDSGQNLNFFMSGLLQAGDYVLVVEEAEFGSGSFNLSIVGSSSAGQLTPPGLDNMQFVNPGQPLFFEFELDERRRVQLTSLGDLNTQASLYNDLLQELAFDANSGEGLNFRLNRVLQPGTYYLLVTEEMFAMGFFDLLFRLLPPFTPGIFLPMLGE